MADSVSSVCWVALSEVRTVLIRFWVSWTHPVSLNWFPLSLYMIAGGGYRGVSAPGSQEKPGERRRVA